jgi:hypothetical protein
LSTWPIDSIPFCLVTTCIWKRNIQKFMLEYTLFFLYMDACHIGSVHDCPLF